LNSADAAEFAKELLSESGSISTHAATEAFTINDGAPAGADTYAASASIVIHDFEENVEEIMGLLQELDTKPAQILVEATILQTSLNEANAFGVDFALIKNLDFSDFIGTGGPLSVIDGLIGGAGELVDGTAVPAYPAGNTSDSGGVSSSVGNTAGPATLKAGLVNGDVAVFMRVLDEVTDVTIVSNPKILTLNRQPARVLVGTRVGYLNTTSTETATTQTVEFLEVGTELAVRPFVSKNGLIRLELRPQVSSFNLRSTTDSTGATVTIPDEDTTEMTTNVMVRDGQTVVLGGLFTETTTAARRQVPILGNIPMIGQAFRGNDDSTRRAEIIFMITPSIVNDTFLSEAGERGNDFVEHARYGARKGLLPWSRERRVGQMLIDAREYADAGQREKALAKIDQALRLQPNSPEARAMRTEVTGEMRIAPTRAMIQSILHGELLEDSNDQVQSDMDFDPIVEINPMEGVQWPDPAQSPEQIDQFEEVEQVAEVSEQLSDASESTESFDAEIGDEFASESVEQAPEEFMAYREVSGDESGSFEITDPAFVEAESFEAASVEDGTFSDDQFTGEQFQSDQFWDEAATAEAVEVESFDADSFDPAPFVEEIASGESQLPDDFSSEQFEEFGYEEVAPGIAIEDDFFSICGQLIISLPGGGALQLDWPLSASDWTSASSKSSESVKDAEELDPNATIYTEVPSVDFE
jgi:type IV pilus assembly protein PilQ